MLKIIIVGLAAYTGAALGGAIADAQINRKFCREDRRRKLREAEKLWYQRLYKWWYKLPPLTQAEINKKDQLAYDENMRLLEWKKMHPKEPLPPRPEPSRNSSDWVI